MRLNPLPLDPDALVRQALWYLLGGLLLVGFSKFFDGCGVISGVMAIGLGASGYVFPDWRTERGLWMLACAFLVLFGPTYCLCLYGELRDFWQGKAFPGWGVWADLLIGTALLRSQVSILAQIIRLNFQISK